MLSVVCYCTKWHGRFVLTSSKRQNALCKRCKRRPIYVIMTHVSYSMFLAYVLFHSHKWSFDYLCFIWLSSLFYNFFFFRCVQMTFAADTHVTFLPNDVTLTIATREYFSIYFALVKSTHTRIHTHGSVNWTHGQCFHWIFQSRKSTDK